MAVAVPLGPVHSQALASRSQYSPAADKIRAGGAGRNAPKQINAPRIPPKTGIHRHSVRHSFASVMEIHIGAWHTHWHTHKR